MGIPEHNTKTESNTVNRKVTLAAALALAPFALLADSVTPDSYTKTLNVGESVTIKKTVTVDAGRPTSAKVDVYFLTDSTGSMGGEIGAVRSAASTILSNTAGLGDVAFGVGEYKDVGDVFVFRHNVGGSHLTTNQATAQGGINQWGASGGGNFPEANLFGLESVATETGWRAGSTRILVWFGDAPGHDPSGPGGVVTEASATAALTGENIVVQAFNTGSLDNTGQATRVTNATGGTLFNGPINTANVIAQIDAAIDATFAEYNTVALDTSGAPAGVTVNVAPAAHNGAFDRSVARDFEFDVTFTGVTPGVYNFPINATVDGGIVATETDNITVVGVSDPVPDAGSTLAFLGLAGALMAVVRRKND